MTDPVPEALRDSQHYYSVLTPEVCEVVPILDDGTGPTECWRDWALVIASTRREAVTKAVKAWLCGNDPDVLGGTGRMWGRSYCERQRDDQLSPWTGVRAEIMRCEHGYEFRGPIDTLHDLLERGHDPCPECDRDLTEPAGRHGDKETR